jgi:hypothetical protein
MSDKGWLLSRQTLPGLAVDCFLFCRCIACVVLCLQSLTDLVLVSAYAARCTSNTKSDLVMEIKSTAVTSILDSLKDADALLIQEDQYTEETASFLKLSGILCMDRLFLNSEPVSDFEHSYDASGIWTHLDSNLQIAFLVRCSEIVCKPLRDPSVTQTVSMEDGPVDMWAAADSILIEKVLQILTTSDLFNCLLATPKLLIRLIAACCPYIRWGPTGDSSLWYQATLGMRYALLSFLCKWVVHFVPRKQLAKDLGPCLHASAQTDELSAIFDFYYDYFRDGCFGEERIRRLEGLVHDACAIYIERQKQSTPLLDIG